MVKVLLLLLVKLLLLLLVNGVVNGDKQEAAAPVLRLVLSQAQKQSLQEAGPEEGGMYYVVCGYREGGRGQKRTGAASGLWSKSLADEGEITLVPQTRQADGREDCSGAFWGGYDELGVGEKKEEDSIKKQEDKETGIENENKSRREAADNIKDKAAMVESRESRESDNNESCEQPPPSMGDWVVAVQTMMNLLFFFIIPLVMRMGYFGARARQWYFRIARAGERALPPVPRVSHHPAPASRPSDHSAGERHYDDPDLSLGAFSDGDNEDGWGHHESSNQGRGRGGRGVNILQPGRIGRIRNRPGYGRARRLSDIV